MKTGAVWVGLSLLLCAGCAARPAAAPRLAQTAVQRLAVLPFDSSNCYVSGAVLSDHFTVRILGSMRGIEVIERKDLMKILEEQKLTLTGVVRPEKFHKLGSILGVHYVLVGSVQTLQVIQSVSGSISVTVKLIEVATGRVLWADRQSVSHASWSAREVPEMAEAIMGKAAKRMVQRMAKDLARLPSPQPEGRVAYQESRLTDGN